MFRRWATIVLVWNDMRVSKWWQNFYFWVNCPFNSTTEFKIYSVQFTSRFRVWGKLQPHVFFYILYKMVFPYDMTHWKNTGDAPLSTPQLWNCDVDGRSASFSLTRIGNEGEVDGKEGGREMLSCLHPHQHTHTHTHTHTATCTLALCER